LLVLFKAKHLFSATALPNAKPPILYDHNVA
jgi:hypothetical protein